MVRFKPVIPLTIIGPTGQVTCPMLLDCGADDVVFPAGLAARIGVDLSSALPGQAQGLGGSQPVGLLYAPVILLLSDRIETCRWRTVVAFTRTSLRLALFGIAGGLEFFRTTLDVGANEIIILPNPSLPATNDPTP